MYLNLTFNSVRSFEVFVLLFSYLGLKSVQLLDINTILPNTEVIQEHSRVRSLVGVILSLSPERASVAFPYVTGLD